jgi:hypothetical protein
MGSCSGLEIDADAAEEVEATAAVLAGETRIEGVSGSLSLSLLQLLLLSLLSVCFSLADAGVPPDGANWNFYLDEKKTK